MLRRLHPGPSAEISDLATVEMVDETRVGSGRPWVMVDMVSSVDGATTLQGGSSGLNDEDDKLVFTALRAAADIVLVGAETVRVEDYGPVVLDDRVVRARRRSGRRDVPRLAVMSRSLDLDPGARLFSGADRPYVFTGRDADSRRRRALDQVAEVVTAGSVGASVVTVLSRLHDDGHRVVLCEGGPAVNGHLSSAGLIDEINLTLSPLIVGGASARIVDGALIEPPLDVRLDRVLVGERMLFVRYRSV